MTSSKMNPQSLYTGHIGFDFGTAFSGFSYLTHGETRAMCFFEYPYQNTGYPKTPTALLYRKTDGKADPKPFAWGGEAIHKYTAFSSAHQKDYLLLEKFKLALAPDASVYDSRPMKAAGLTVEKVIADYLEVLNKFARDHIKTRYSTWDFGSTRYAITVPAEWGDAAKQAMRRAAARAGIIGSPDSEQLVLVYEPEAAALACQMRGDISLRGGEAFMVVDAGGGTVDVTWHEVVGSGSEARLEDASHREGLTYGGRILDEQFEAMVRRKLGDRILAEWRALPKYGTEFLRLMENWQRVKHSFDGESSAEYVGVGMPNSLTRLLPMEMEEEFEKSVDDLDHFPVQTKDMQKLFDDVIGAVMRKVEAMRDRVGPLAAPSKVLLVGGMSANKYYIKQMRQRLAQTFSGTAEVIAPNYGYGAVVEGAALYAKNPNIISARRAMLTYGFRTAQKAEADSPEGTVYFSETKKAKYCRHFFKKVVGKNDRVGINEVKTCTQVPLEKGQASVVFDIYATAAEKVPKYTTDIAEGMLGQVTLLIDDPSKVVNPDDYKLEVTMTFGSTEIEFKAVDLQTKRIAKANVTFARSYS